MSETGAILIVVGLFVGFFALAVVGLKIKDRLRHPENAGRITARPDQWRAAILVSVCLLAIPLIVWLKRTFSPTELLLVVVPLAIVFVVWMSRKRSGVNALLESLANEFGWIEDPARGKRSFTVLPEENVVRSWQGRRVGLSILDPARQSVAFGRLRYTLEVPAMGTLEIRAVHKHSPEGPRPLEARGDRLDLDSTLRERHGRELTNLLSNAGDRLSLKDRRLVIDLILNVRAIPSEGPEPTLLPAYAPARPDLPALEKLLRATWPDLRALAGAFSV